MTTYGYKDSLPEHINETLANHRVTKNMRKRTRVFADTTDFTSIDYGDIICVDNRYFLVTSFTKEGRFGVDDQIKPWVPKVEDLETKERRILKLVFYETFDVTFGPYTIPFFRSPDKEARVLELTRGHKHFMQGESVKDDAGNIIRILEIVNGSRLDKVIHRSNTTHEDYYHNELPQILRNFDECMKSITLLHAEGIRHGDIRRDHVYVERTSGRYVWIDFDYDYYIPERPFAIDLFELGNILIYLTGRDDFLPRTILTTKGLGEEALAKIEPQDYSLLSTNKVINLKKLYPYVSDRLNNIFLHFSKGSNVFYETIEELAEDLSEALAEF